MDQHYLKALYLSGLTFRQIGAKLGFSHFKAWWHMRKLQDHTSTVTNILIARVYHAERAYYTTRTHARRKRLRLAVAVLRQRRPDVYAAAVERGRPKACEGCAGAIHAHLARGLWAWQCGYCGAAGFKKPESIAVLLRNNGPKGPASST